jgi:riboflavin kinase/FMN adenylyltransferase
VLTFLQHPRSVLTREHPGALTTLRQRRERFAALGVTHLVLIDFSVQFSRLSGREFVAALRRGMALDTLVVGVDFRCGRGRDTDVAELQRLLAPAGVRVVAVPPVTVGGYAVSSTRIRAAVRAGDFAATEEMMGLPFEVDLRAALETTSPAVSDHEAAFDYGATSRRLYVAAEQMEQILPQPGTYATSVVTAGGGAVAAVAEVAPDGVRCTLPAGLRELPLGLRFHRRADARCGTLPLVEGGAAIASRIQEK